MQKASFAGHDYCHPMVAETQRRVAVSITAQTLMQTFFGNRYLALSYMTDWERAYWKSLAEDATPSITIS